LKEYFRNYFVLRKLIIAISRFCLKQLTIESDRDYYINLVSLIFFGLKTLFTFYGFTFKLSYSALVQERLYSFSFWSIIKQSTVVYDITTTTILLYYFLSNKGTELFNMDDNLNWVIAIFIIGQPFAAVTNYLINIPYYFSIFYSVSEDCGKSCSLAYKLSESIYDLILFAIFHIPCAIRMAIFAFDDSLPTIVHWLVFVNFWLNYFSGFPMSFNLIYNFLGKCFSHAIK